MKRTNRTSRVLAVIIVLVASTLVGTLLRNDGLTRLGILVAVVALVVSLWLMALWWAPSGRK